MSIGLSSRPPPQAANACRLCRVCAAEEEEDVEDTDEALVRLASPPADALLTAETFPLRSKGRAESRGYREIAAARGVAMTDGLG